MFLFESLRLVIWIFEVNMMLGEMVFFTGHW